ncbi:winged helix-turn-helix domain-containing protein [Streptosporangium sp. KLBMP 9127]|nr:transcriptional regulator [Streptosporangium sp. KLBMP 9127]
MTHPRKSLDNVIHMPIRFSIVAALSGVDEAEFKVLRDAIEITDSALSKQLAILVDADYVKMRKTFVGNRPRTYLSLTKTGRTVLERHLAALREIAGGL